MSRGQNDDPAGTGGGDTPDWTTWLRSRLERVARSERRGAEVVSDTEAEGDGDGAEDEVDEDGPTGTDVPPPSPMGAEDTAAIDPQLDWLQPSQPDAAARATSALRTGPVPPPPVPVAPHAPPPPPPAEPAAAPPPPGPAFDRDLESVMTAVVALTARIDALVDATTGYRTALDERLDEHGEAVLRAITTDGSDREEHRRSHDAAIAEVQRSTTETAGTLRRLTDEVEHLATVVGDDERWVGAVRTVVDADAAERRAAGQRTEDALTALSERLDGIEGAVSGIATLLSGLQEHLAPPGDDEPWAEAVRQVFEEVAGAHRGDEERAEEALSGIPERLGDVERALGQLAAELAEARAQPAPPAPELGPAQVRAIATAVAEMLGDRPPASPAPATPAGDRPPEKQGPPRPATPRRRSAPLRASSPRRR